MTRNNLHKKSIIIIIGFFCFIGYARAQTIEAIRGLWQQNSLAHARQAVDSFLLQHRTSAEGWLLKAMICNSIARSPEYQYLLADARMEAWQSLQQAEKLGPAYVEAQLKPTDYAMPNDLYYGYTNEALTYYNAATESNDRNQYSEALQRFKKAGLVSAYIYGKGWGMNMPDTSNIYYTAKAAISAGKEEDALIYSKKIADAGVYKTSVANDVETIYHWLVYYYKQKQEGAAFFKYVEQGRQHFTNDVYFTLVTLDWYRKQKDYPKLLATYQTQPSKQYQWQYLQDVYNYLYTSGQTVPNRAALQKQLLGGLLDYLLLQSLGTNNNAAEARLLIAKVYINQARDNKTSRRKLLQLSNSHLQKLISDYSKTNSNTYKEALKLLARNNRVLKG
ncbi:hypothetical protein [Ferruginibacter sp.]